MTLRVDTGLILQARPLIEAVFPETREIYERLGKTGCPVCSKRRLGGAILSIVVSLPKEGRRVERLRGIIPMEYLR
jgi:hypothetical protein